MQELRRLIVEKSEYEKEQIIYSLPFSIDLFKLLPFSPELEVMIGRDGTIYYARPSHQEFLIRKAMEMENCSRDELYKKCPVEFQCKFLNWLIDVSDGFIPVWGNFFIANILTKKQRSALKKLKLEGLYKGRITIPKM